MFISKASNGWKSEFGTLAKTVLVLLSGLLAVVSAGCMGKTPARKYLMLQLDTSAYHALDGKNATSPANKQTESAYSHLGGYGAPSGCSIAVAEFSAHSAYDSDRLAYRVSPFQLGYYGYWHWVTKPGKLVADELRRDIKRRGLFERVNSEYSQADRGGLLLSGIVEAMEEVDKDDEVYAHLALTMELYSDGAGAGADAGTSEGNGTVWRRSWDLSEKVEKKGPVEVASSMNNLLERIANELAAELAGNSSIKAACIPNDKL